MKKLFIWSLLAICFYSCSDSQTTTSLEGVWKLQNNSAGAKLTFQGENWTLNSGNYTITGTFTLKNNQTNGQTCEYKFRGFKA